jgi:GNAT superfamily N-acetyltransferase
MLGIGAKRGVSGRDANTFQWESQMTEISRLCHIPWAVPILAQWFLAEWPDYYGLRSTKDIEKDFILGDGSASLPIVFVAHESGTIFGTAALRKSSIDSHRHLTPWVGGLLVASQHRGRGVGTLLIEEVRSLAGDLGYVKSLCSDSPC